MKISISYDFETLATSPRAAVLSLGMVRFNAETILSQRKILFDMNEQCNTRVISASTLVWWQSQHPDAKKVFEESQREGMRIKEAMGFINEFYQGKGELIWGNGANFDPVILDSLYAQIGQIAPWPFWDVRCLRTLKSLFPEAADIPFQGVKHDCLSDALHQARQVMNINKRHPGIIR